MNAIKLWSSHTNVDFVVRDMKCDQMVKEHWGATRNMGVSNSNGPSIPDLLFLQNGA